MALKDKIDTFKVQNMIMFKKPEEAEQHVREYLNTRNLTEAELTFESDLDNVWHLTIKDGKDSLTLSVRPV